MNTITKYQCSTCKNIYDSKEECQKCESNHIKPKKMISCCFMPYKHAGDQLMQYVGNNLDCTYPISIFIQMEDGKELEYRLENIKKKETPAEKAFGDAFKSLFDGVDPFKRKEKK